MNTSIVKFLLVDDLPENLLVLQGVLRRDDVQLLCAHSGREALELLLKHEVALAIVDVQMPDMDGFELAELMRGAEKTRHVPIIFLTAGAADEQRKFRGYEMGAVDFLYKPVEPHVLRSKADVFLVLHRHRVEITSQRDALQSALIENARLLDEARGNQEVLRKEIQAREAAEGSLRAAEAELRRQNETLEVVVEQRTAKLRETVAELEAFSYSIVHDMRAPLRAMHGFSDILLTDHSAELSPEAAGYLDRIASAARRMDRLIQDVLSYSKVIRGDIPLVKVELDKLIPDIIETYPNFRTAKDTFVIQGALPCVIGNEAMLTQCLSNLFDNALKFSRPEVPLRITISSAQENGRARVFVADNGIGIPDTQLETIFGIFNRLDQSRDGTGIGLAIVDKACRRMRGTVGVSSAVNVGSTFWIELECCQ